MNYKISIEGQTFDMEEAIAGDDAKLRSALTPFFPGAANAKFMRSEPKEDVITVTVVKQAGTKGYLDFLPISQEDIKDIQLLGPIAKKSLGRAFQKSMANIEPEDQVLRRLIEAKEGINPVVALYQDPTSKPMNQMSFEEMIRQEEEISRVIEMGDQDIHNMVRTFESITETDALAAPVLIEGF